ncbi:MAG: tetratricopeptide repeat protein [Pseudomonadota bacterium]
MIVTFVALLMTSAYAPNAASEVSSASPQKEEQSALSSQEIAAGDARIAIEQLERQLERDPADPALLINLGIAHAHAGDDELAKAMFERAMTSPDPITLETADGKLVDSRRLARRAMRMLAKGKFSLATQ